MLFVGHMHSLSTDRSQLSGIHPFMSCDSITIPNVVSMGTGTPTPFIEVEY